MKQILLMSLSAADTPGQVVLVTQGQVEAFIPVPAAGAIPVQVVACTLVPAAAFTRVLVVACIQGLAGAYMLDLVAV
jgi:hypothetical protein